MRMRVLAALALLFAAALLLRSYRQPDGQATAPGGPPSSTTKRDPTPDDTTTPAKGDHGATGTQRTQQPPAQPGPPAGAPARHAALSATDVAAIEEAVERARRWYLATPHDIVYSALIGDVIWRRHALPGFGGMAQQVADAVSAGDLPETFARLALPGARASQDALAKLASPIDQVTIRVLHCQQLPITPEVAARLPVLLEQGRYETTHALLALLWAEDNGCRLPGHDALRRAALEANRALLDLQPPLHDIQIEAAALLAMAGAGDRVPPAFIRAVLAAQLPSGGWSEGGRDGDPPHWHPTAFAVLALLEQTRAPRGSFVAH